MNKKYTLAATLFAAAGVMWSGPFTESFTEQKTKKRVTIVMFSTPNILPYARLAADINEAYAARHGYGFVHEIQHVEDTVDIMWKTVEVIRRHLASADAVMYIDSDAAFNDHSKNLEFLFDVPGEIIGCSDQPNGPHFINGGLVFVKNSLRGTQLMDAWWRMKSASKKYHTFAYEQQALHDLAESTPPGRITALPAETFNSIYANLKKGKRDTFVLHFMSFDKEARIREFQAMKTRLLGADQK